MHRCWTFLDFDMRGVLNWFSSLREIFARPPHFDRVQAVTDWPDVWRPATVYVQGDDGHEWFAAFVCPCGCRDIVYLNLLPHSRPKWGLTRNRRGYPTLNPSVARKVKCHAHFLVTEGRIISCSWNESADRRFVL